MSDWFYYTGTGGETTISTPLAGNIVIGLYRNGTYYRKVTTTPSGKQYRFDFATGDIIFPVGFPSLEAGEQVDIMVSNDIVIEA